MPIINEKVSCYIGFYSFPAFSKTLLDVLQKNPKITATVVPPVEPSRDVANGAAARPATITT